MGPGEGVGGCIDSKVVPHSKIIQDVRLVVVSYYDVYSTESSIGWTDKIFCDIAGCV